MKKRVFEGMKKGKQVTFNEDGSTTELDSISPVTIILSGPEGEQPKMLKKEDVWGNNEGYRGMMVARYEEKCPHFGDVLEYKSYTFVCKEEQFDEVQYWLEYVLGGDCVSDTMKIKGDLNLIAIRADYMCW